MRKSIPEIPDLCSVTQAATLLGLSRQRVYQLIWMGELEAVRVDGFIMVRKHVVEERLGEEDGKTTRD